MTQLKSDFAIHTYSSVTIDDGTRNPEYWVILESEEARNLANQQVGWNIERIDREYPHLETPHLETLMTYIGVLVEDGLLGSVSGIPNHPPIDQQIFLNGQCEIMIRSILR